MAIQSFGNAVAEKVAGRQRVASLHPDVQKVAQRKLALLEFAKTLDDLRVPPGNRLEKLRGDREGQHSIRINDQWRLCFRWTPKGPAEVELVDYHR
ncbi:type II toxin-antitoxin system RelE/ParE family toxin [Actinomycetospora termitidis]|uniref:Type II toxin-antitoxin system RelE/ParE family toxin n=1 Tax=Actinomycetospora termitidis TaxID=3053470 RepID=A0ABT7MAC3_9PSEU|nr:type II toxin-antitoxin system RelE/ParE family toxin [Actinomycetospora sp. Odt1-22]MDL5157610.1 type II toxin-antitoxin system RelE/ParE family toxin [Actinomycetospora sp. Odt1-22]